MLTMVLWENPDDLYGRLYHHRYNWVVDFLHDTAVALLAEIDHVAFTRYDLQVLYRYADKRFVRMALALPTTTPHWQRYTAGMLYDLFRACRKLCLEDQETIGYNFNTTRLPV